MQLATNDLGEKLLAVRVGKARRSLAEFVRYGWHVLEPGVTLEWNWHIQALCDHVQAMLEDWHRHRLDPTYVQRALNMLINVPPGTLKSRIMNVYAPAWMWLHCPEWSVLCLSLNPEAALRDARLSKQVIKSAWYRSWFQPDWEISADRDAAGDYANTRGGFRQSKGITAKVIGQRADAIFLDDPNDAKLVYGGNHCKEIAATFTQSIYNRVNDRRTSIRIIIMQRLHEHDLAGHVLRSGKWAHLMIPLEFEPKRRCTTVFGWTDPRTVEGEVMHPARFTPAVILDEKKNLGSYGYAGQMQQRPAPADGGVFKREWWRWYRDPHSRSTSGRPEGANAHPAIDMPAKFDWMILSVDASFKDLKTSSRVSCQVIAGAGPDRFVLDVVTKHMGLLATCEAIVALRDKWRPTMAAAGLATIETIIEDKANGPAIIELLQSKVDGLKAIIPKGSKESRCQAISPLVESGNVWLPEGASWIPDFFDELSTFPAAEYDDQADSLSQGITYKSGMSAAERFKAMATR